MIQAQDAGADSLRRALDGVFESKAYQWVEPANPFAIVERWWDRLSLWIDRLGEQCPRCVDGIALLLIVILAAIMAHAIWIFMRTVRGSRYQEAGVGPGKIGRDQHWYRREADSLAAEGRYVEAMQAEFLALILALDAARTVRFHPGKTPAEYLREVQLTYGQREEFRELVHGLYGYAFARWPCDANTFADWRAHASPGRYAPTQ